MTVKAAYQTEGRDEGSLPKGHTSFWGGTGCNPARVAHICSKMVVALASAFTNALQVALGSVPFSKLLSPAWYLNQHSPLGKVMTTVLLIRVDACHIDSRDKVTRQEWVFAAM